MADARSPAADRGIPGRGDTASTGSHQGLRKYFTRRCVGLHIVVVVLVPTFLAAGWWQYTVARSGNALSWVYTVEWPFFAAYAIYVWWKLIHDKSTPFDRLWAAKQRAAADAAGTPIYQIPGWATDKELSRAVHTASLDARRDPALVAPRPNALEAEVARAQDPGPVGRELVRSTADDHDPTASAAGGSAHDDVVIDARVLDVQTVVDEELEAHDAYNRFLFELSRSDPPKRWTSRRRRARGDAGDSDRAAATNEVHGPGARVRPSLPEGMRDQGC